MVFWFEQCRGVTLICKVWYLLIITQVHALHTRGSPFAGMLMFTEPQVTRLKELAQVSRPSQCGLHDLHAPCRAN